MRPAAISRGGGVKASRRCLVLGKRPGRGSAVSGRDIESERWREQRQHAQDGAERDGRDELVARHANQIPRATMERATVDRREQGAGEARVACRSEQHGRKRRG